MVGSQLEEDLEVVSLRWGEGSEVVGLQLEAD